MTWEMICRHLGLPEEKRKVLKVMVDAFNIQIIKNALSRATNIADLKSLDNWRKESLLPRIVMRISHDTLWVLLK